MLYSLAMPIVGSDWFAALASSEAVRARYREHTKRPLEEEDDLDYSVLSFLAVGRSCQASWTRLTDMVRSGQRELAKVIGSNRLTTFGSLLSENATFDTCSRQSKHSAHCVVTDLYKEPLLNIASPAARP
jgi:hypothetical protein